MNLLFGSCFTKHLVLGTQKIENGDATKYQTTLSDIVRHPKMHVCAYGHIITNYVTILAITLVVWPESHETSNMIAHYEKVF